MDFHDCSCTGKSLARLIQPAVMAVLATEPLHGYLIVQRLGKMLMFCDEAPDPTGVYRVLKAMEQDGLVDSSWDLAASGPAKRSYRLTAQGRACLTLWGQTLGRYERSIRQLLRIVRRSGSGQSRKGGGCCGKRTGSCA